MDAADRIARTIASGNQRQSRAGRGCDRASGWWCHRTFVAAIAKVTGGLDDTQLRNLAERLAYLRELEAPGRDP